MRAGGTPCDCLNPPKITANSARFTQMCKHTEQGPLSEPTWTHRDVTWKHKSPIVIHTDSWTGHSMSPPSSQMPHCPHPPPSTAHTTQTHSHTTELPCPADSTMHGLPSRGHTEPDRGTLHTCSCTELLMHMPPTHVEPRHAPQPHPLTDLPPDIKTHEQGRLGSSVG